MGLCGSCEIEPTLSREEMERRVIDGAKCDVCPECGTVIRNHDAEEMGINV